MDEEEEEEKGCYWSSAASADPCLYSQLFLGFILLGCVTVGSYGGRCLDDIHRFHSDITYLQALSSFFVFVFSCLAAEICKC